MNKFAKYSTHYNMTVAERVIANELAEMNRLKRLQLEAEFDIKTEDMG